MVWNKWIEDVIWAMYRNHGCDHQTEQMSMLKRICMDEINSHKGLKDTLKTRQAMEYFITQMMMENVCPVHNCDAKKTKYD